MNIYNETINRIEQGVPFRCDIRNKTLKTGSLTLIDKGKVDGELGFSFDGIWEELNQLYADYKYSTPSERFNNKEHSKHNKPLFFAYKADDLTDEQLVMGQNREVCQFKLEYAVLCLILTKKWEDIADEKHWFVHGTDRDFVIFKEWFN